MNLEGKVLAELLGGDLEFGLHNHVVFLELVLSFKALPRELPFEEVYQHINYGLEIVPTCLLYP